MFRLPFLEKLFDVPVRRGFLTNKNRAAAFVFAAALLLCVSVGSSIGEESRIKTDLLLFADGVGTHEIREIPGGVVLLFIQTALNNAEGFAELGLFFRSKGKLLELQDPGNSFQTGVQENRISGGDAAFHHFNIGHGLGVNRLAVFPAVGDESPLIFGSTQVVAVLLFLERLKLPDIDQIVADLARDVVQHDVFGEKYLLVGKVVDVKVIDLVVAPNVVAHHQSGAAVKFSAVEAPEDNAVFNSEIFGAVAFHKDRSVTVGAAVVETAAHSNSLAAVDDHTCSSAADDILEKESVNECSGLVFNDDARFKHPLAVDDDLFTGNVAQSDAR